MDTNTRNQIEKNSNGNSNRAPFSCGFTVPSFIQFIERGAWLAGSGEHVTLDPGCFLHLSPTSGVEIAYRVLLIEYYMVKFRYINVTWGKIRHQKIYKGRSYNH